MENNIVVKSSIANKISDEYRKNMQIKFGIVGDSEPVQKAIDALVEVAPTDLAVLITGETGTGKEVFANAVHSLSDRKNKPFISVNCGAIPETLLESELFGHEKGAFTSANDQRIGFFEAANKGTIFLDEIGEMPIGTQVKLLRILESGEFSRLGSSSVNKVDVRLIAATNRNLQEEVKKRNFRQDLFYRLNSVNIVLPPLRNHIQDIPLYFDFFSNKICEKNSIRFLGISEEAISILKALPWQGNIREFKNLVDKIITLERGAYIDTNIINKYIPPALPEFSKDWNHSSLSIIPTNQNNEIMSNDSIILRTLLDIKHDISDIKQALAQMGAAFQDINEDINSIKDSLIVTYDTDSKMNGMQHQSFNNNEYLQFDSIADMEKIHIINALQKLQNNKRRTAIALGISERTLYRKIKEYDIK
jgi:DNA-binding NtrC family response regulator